MSDVAAYAVLAVDHPAAQNAIIRIGGDDAYSWQEVVNMVGEIVGQPVPVNYAAPGDPIPLLPEAMVPILFGLETFDSYVNMNAASMVFGIQPTPLRSFLQNMLAPEAAASVA